MNSATEEADMLWTALMGLLILCLVGFGIQLGWGLTHLLLAVAFGGAGHQPADRAQYCNLGISQSRNGIVGH